MKIETPHSRSTPGNKRDTIVLVHGLLGSRLDMWPMSRRLTRAGFQTWNWSYRSTRQRIETLVDLLGRDLAKLNRQTRGRFHLVTHSMGGVIARAVFETWKFDRLGRLVMLAPPHGGSHVARMMFPWFNWLTPSLQQLSDGKDSFVNQLPNSFLNNCIEFGLIEAKRDRVVKPTSVRIAGYQDFAVVDGHHGILPWYPETIQLVENFMMRGRFKTPSDSFVGSNDRRNIAEQIAKTRGQLSKQANELTGSFSKFD